MAKKKSAAKAKAKAAKKKATPKPEKPKKLYIVHATAWEYNDMWYTAQGGYGEPVKLFRDRKKAEAYRDQLEAKERQGNPFEFCDGEASGPSRYYHQPGVENVSSMCEEEFVEVVLSLGLQPPDFAKADKTDDDAICSWYAWWEATDMTDDQYFRLWECCDQLQFYAISEVDPEIL